MLGNNVRMSILMGMLFYAKATAYLECGGFLDAVELANAFNCSVVSFGNLAKRIALFDFVVHRTRLGRGRLALGGGGTRGGRGGGGNRSAGTVAARRCVAMGRPHLVKRMASKIECLHAKLMLVAIDDMLGVHGVTHIANLEMEMAAIGATGVAAKANDIASLHLVTRRNLTATHVSIVGLKTVVVTNHHQISIGTIVGRHADGAVEGSVDRFSCGLSDVDSIVPTIFAGSEVRSDDSRFRCGIMELHAAVMVHQMDNHCVRHF